MIFGKINCAVTNLVFKTSVCYRKVSEKLEFILRHIALIKGRYHLKMEQELHLVFISALWYEQNRFTQGLYNLRKISPLDFCQYNFNFAFCDQKNLVSLKAFKVQFSFELFAKLKRTKKSQQFFVKFQCKSLLPNTIVLKTP